MTDGITFKIVNGETAMIEEGHANEQAHNAARIKLDIAAYKRMVEQALRDQAGFIIQEENYNDKIRSGIDRMVEVAVKSAQGQITKMVQDEVARLVREQVAKTVQAMPISVQVSIGGPQ